jgi:3-phosphoshikimate 1-carboxyvinyltransferase
MDGTVSSQFISALMMIAPLLDGGLEIELTGEVLSIPYIEMTASVMSHYGINADFNGNLISIPHGNYHSKDLVVEPDWSAASYWYEILALSDMKQILLKGLTAKSLQGDKCIDNLMTQFGITTTYTSEGALIEKQTGFDMPDYFIYDFSACPDLAPAVAVLCGGLNITADLPGLKNFRLKESDRASALQRELYNFNIKTDFCGGSKFKLYAGRGPSGTRHEIRTYNDHRIAMAMAPLCCLAGSFLIDNPLVTEKSYPDYFHDLEKAGFKISVIT